MIFTLKVREHLFKSCKQMPELPEVETVVRSLKKVCLNGVIKKPKFYREDLREKIPIKVFKQVTNGKKIQAVSRRSKYIIIETKEGAALFHLGMTGQFLCLNSSKPSHAHTHLVFELHQKNKIYYLHFVDPRRFGRISAHVGPKWNDHPYFEALGREPLVGGGLGKYLWECGKGSKRSIKSLLMDNKVIVGIGNIYACETLFMAGVNPQRLSYELSELEFSTLAKSSRIILKKAIHAGGTTIRDFRDMKGNSGYFSISLKVYNRAGEPCIKCNAKIAHVKQSGRSSWFCPICQK